MNAAEVHAAVARLEPEEAVCAYRPLDVASAPSLANDCPRPAAPQRGEMVRGEDGVARWYAGGREGEVGVVTTARRGRAVSLRVNVAGWRGERQFSIARRIRDAIGDSVCVEADGAADFHFLLTVPQPVEVLHALGLAIGVVALAPEVAMRRGEVAPDEVASLGLFEVRDRWPWPGARDCRGALPRLAHCARPESWAAPTPVNFSIFEERLRRAWPVAGTFDQWRDARLLAVRSAL